MSIDPVLERMLALATARAWKATEIGDRAGVGSRGITAGQMQSLGIGRDDDVSADVHRTLGGNVELGKGVGVLRSAAVEGKGGDAHIAQDRDVAFARVQK